MENLRKYGHLPFKAAVIHGGPGAPGEMALVARDLCPFTGILEPLQTACTIEGQIEELKLMLANYGNLPLTLIGFSWGAWLSYIFAASFPSFVAKLLLISSGPFLDKYATTIMETRLNRLGEEERREVICLMETLNDPAFGDKNEIMSRFGRHMYKADSYHPLPYSSGVVKLQHDVYQNIWKEASELRSTGKLLEYGRKIQCNVVAIHGDYDPHPLQGVKEPLSGILKDFRFILLKNCGHYPWMEKDASDTFYKVLKQELK